MYVIAVSTLETEFIYKGLPSVAAKAEAKNSKSGSFDGITLELASYHAPVRTGICRNARKMDIFVSMAVLFLVVQGLWSHLQETMVRAAKP